MGITLQKKIKKRPIPSKESKATAHDNMLRHLAFDNSLQANIVSTLSSGKIILANNAACQLLGYSKKTLLTKSRADIFDIKDSNFKKMHKQRVAEGRSMAFLIAIKKSGKFFPCEITSSVFKNGNGIKQAVTTMADMSQSILRQKKIDYKKARIVADNIVFAKSKQKSIAIKTKKRADNNIVLAQSRQRSIDTKNKKAVAQNIVLAQSKQRKIDTRKEKIVAHNIVMVESRQRSIDIKNRKTVAQNIVLAQSKQRKIDTKKEKIVAHNIVMVESKQKKIDTRKDKVLAHIIVLAKSNQKKIDTKKEKIVAHNIVLAQSKQKKIDIEKEKRVASNIILAQAKSDARLEEKLGQEIATSGKLLTEYMESFKVIFNSSSDVLFDSDLITNEVIVSDAYEKEFGYKLTSNMTPADDWTSHIHPFDRDDVMQDYERMLASSDTEWKYSYRFLRADGSVANVISNRIILRNADGKAYRMIGTMQDISKQRVLEEKLEQEIRLKEKQISDAMQEAKETERSDIGKELHDNVNQLLGVSRLYLEMAKRGDDNSEMYLSRSSEYTLSAIEEIRKLTKGLTTDIIKDLGLCQAINNIIRDTMEINPVKISCTSKSFIEDSVNDKFKHNVFRIVQEQLTNILKHAKATKVVIRLAQNKKLITLSVSDNGVGFDTNQKGKGIGIINIKSRASSYKGIADFVSQPGHGCVLTVTFPVTNALLNKIATL